MIRMRLLGVRSDLPANTPMVLLQEEHDGGRILPIMIGNYEAQAIHNALEGVLPPRPLTHDLAVSLVSALGGQLDRVVVTEVRNHTYFAELHLRSGAAESVVSSRPSDAIALAVRSGAPIFVSEPLLDAEGQVPADDGDDEETILDEFRDFLDDLDPDDFAD